MSTRSYRFLVVGCMLAWFLLGMHAPIVHQVVEHGRVPRTPVVLAVALLAAAALGGLWALLRVPRRGAV
jgi:hypothetical protein